MIFMVSEAQKRVSEAQKRVGYDIWYYTDPLGRYLIYTSLAIAPMWFALGLVSENFTNFVLKYTDKNKRLRMLGVFDV